MAILNVVAACAHLQNATRAQLGLTSLPNTKSLLNFSLALHRAGLISSVTRGGPTPPPLETLLTATPEPVTTANVSTRRLWLGLKYVDNQPVMRVVQSITKPKRPIIANLAQLHRIARGFDSSYIKGLKLGECMFIGTDKGILEIREALERKVGGLVIARIAPY